MKDFVVVPGGRLIAAIVEFDDDTRIAIPFDAVKVTSSGDDIGLEIPVEASEIRDMDELEKLAESFPGDCELQRGVLWDGHVARVNDHPRGKVETLLRALENQHVIASAGRSIQGHQMGNLVAQMRPIVGGRVCTCGLRRRLPVAPQSARPANCN